MAAILGEQLHRVGEDKAERLRRPEINNQLNLRSRYRKLTQSTPYTINKLYHLTIVGNLVMTLAYVFPGALPSARPGILPSALVGVAIKVVYFSLVTTAFVFMSILLTGIHA